MMPSISRTGFRLLLLALLVASPLAGAQQSGGDDKLRSMLRETTMQLRQAQATNNQLRAELQQKEQELARLQSRSEQLEGKLDQRQKQARQLQGQVQANQARVGQARDLIQQWQAQYRELEELARSRDRDAQRFEQRYGKVNEYVQACYQDNQELVALNQEILRAYKDKGVWRALVSSEPLTGLGKVKMEKLTQKYQHAVKEHEVAPFDRQALGPEPVNLPVGNFPGEPGEEEAATGTTQQAQAPDTDNREEQL